MTNGSYWKEPRQHRARGWLLQVHLWCGIAIGVWALAIGLSGSVLVFKDEIEVALHPEVFRVQPPVSSGQQTVPSLDMVAASVRNRFPAHSIGGFRNLHETHRSAYVWIYRLDANGDLIHRYNVHFNRYSGKLLGAVERYEGFPGWFEKLHFFLLMGRPGLLVNGFMAIALVAMCATGAALWWPGKSRIQRGVRIQWRSGWKRLNYDLHSVGGLFTLALLCLMACTGMYFGFNSQARAWLGWLGNGQQAMSAFFTPPRVELSPGQQALPLDSILGDARASAGVLQVANLTLPRRPGDAITVDALYPGNPVLAGMVRSSVHPVSGEIVRRMDSKEQPVGVRIALAVAPIHFGQWGGLPAKILWAILGFVPGGLFVSGFLLWWNRAIRKQLGRSRVPFRAYSTRQGAA